ncbi:hypothetical protein [Deinococcus ruber]|uniref:Uncharacterized protein n=1 Tax=Deinococcus ruber TaxID=1848197 RepID=A0A918F7Y4_9DEIO|nr:hypothetical protein [Deinococcus ruber]GGR09805.1 hypothetical protein GCM10008957_23210 [Deinococcus ruber]
MTETVTQYRIAWRDAEQLADAASTAHLKALHLALTSMNLSLSSSTGVETEIKQAIETSNTSAQELSRLTGQTSRLASEAAEAAYSRYIAARDAARQARRELPAMGTVA